MTDIQKHKQLIKDYSKDSYLKLMRTPMQRLSYPFIVPGASYTYQLWDWDSWLTDVGIRQILKDNGGAGNPSCWLGPMWGVANYLCFRGLVNYGYTDEAKALAEAIITVYGRDIEGCGEMHEYYHCDTGEGINGQGFQSWNLLVNNMIAYIEGRDAVEEF